MTCSQHKPSFELSATTVSENDRFPVKLKRSLREAVFDVLATAEIATVTVKFDGYSDTGQVEETLATRAGNVSVALAAVMTANTRQPAPTQGTTSPSLTKTIEEAVYGLLADSHGGWRNNYRACGPLVRCRATHRLRFSRLVRCRTVVLRISIHGHSDHRTAKIAAPFREIRS